MTYIETTQIYYNTRLYFRDHIMDTLPNNQTDWYYGYRSWLAEQGCAIVKYAEKDLAVDALGVSPGYDRFGFENEQDATMFMLRWV